MSRRIELLEDIANVASQLHEKCRISVESGACDIHKKMLLSEIGLSLENSLLALQTFDGDAANG
jgi:hypothetical protein